MKRFYRLTQGAVLCTLLALIVFVPVYARGGSEAQINLERAKIKFSEKQYQEALSLLDAALEEEPENGEALHYAGLCLLALGKAEAAAGRLDRAAKLLPGDPGVWEDLAWAEVESGDYDAALKAADQALKLNPESEAGRFYKGQALMGKKEFESALSLFQELSGSREFGQAAEYYAGLCLLRLGRTQDARPHFESAEKLGPDTEIGKKAGNYAKALAEGRKPAKAIPLRAKVRLLYQYDTNIVPVNNEDFLPEQVSDMEDGRAVVDLDLRYWLLSRAGGSAYVRYLGYGSWHSEETDLNLSFHQGELGGRLRTLAGGIQLTPGVRASYTGNYLDGELYTSVWRAIPELGVKWNESLITRLEASFEGEKFDEPGEGENDLDNNKWLVSLYQHFLLAEGKVNAWVGYGYGQVDADGDNYNRVDQNGYAGIAARMPREITGLLLFRYEERDYPDNAFDRHEKRYIGSGSLEIPVYKQLAAYLGVSYMSVDANEKPLEYERWIYSAGLAAAF